MSQEHNPSAEDPSTEELYSMSVPSPEAGRRFMQVLTELWCNTPNEVLDGRTPWEFSMTNGGPQALRERLSPDTSSEPGLVAMREEELSLVPRPEQRQVVTFRCSGGLLNVFTDRPTEDDDDDWGRIEARCRQEVPSRDAKALAAATRRAAMEWNAQPSVLFAGLTPLQVLAGGGPQEAQLEQHMARFLEETLDPEAQFPSPAAVARSSLLLLRRWQVTPIRGLGRSPQQVILQERSDILRKKLSLMASL